MGYSIHFCKEKEPDQKRKVLRIQLGKKNQDLEPFLKNTSSDLIKSMLNVKNYEQLKDNALAKKISVNSYVIQKIYQLVSKSPSNLFDGIEGTYRGNTEDFFHHLFPYLEAFSPNFVTSIQKKYAPDAKFLLDPFGGLGTAPFTFANESQLAFYCEVNPVMQHIAELKNRLRRTSVEERKKVISVIDELILDIENKLDSYLPDTLLKNSLDVAFEKSDFFPERSLQQILKIRTYIDKLYCKNTLLATCLELSVIASLVPVSNMQRAGDLRKKRPAERAKSSEDLCAHVKSKLNFFKSGLLTFESKDIQPILVADDSKKLSDLTKLDVDLVVTSPPYLNGTNYFRNTKLELWFTRVIQDNGDLGLLRNKAITSGINDVRGNRASSNPSLEFKSLKKCLKQLDECAYDKRIPKMIRWYGHDIFKALSGAVFHLKKGGVIAVDIGDSIYCGVHVPTDLLIAEVLEINGCQIIDNLVVRKRISRSGEHVKQVCVVAKKIENKKSNDVKTATPYFQKKWDYFKNELPHAQEPFASRSWGHPNHSMCSYQGKLKPSIGKFLIDAFVPDGGRMLDPFSGVGTIPFEAALSGKMSYGFDISPTAYSISQAKLVLPNAEVVMEKLSHLQNFIEAQKEKIDIKTWLPGFNKPLVDYYHQDTLKEVLCAREWFQRQSPWDEYVCMLLACSMHILHGNRPYALSRRSHPVTPFAPTGDFEYRSFVEKLSQKVTKSIYSDYPSEFKSGKIFLQDATESWPLEVENLDAIITSPPFFDSTRFHMANWIRLWFAGWGENEFKYEQKRFVDEKQKLSFDCYHPILRQAKDRLKNGGALVFHLGKSNKCDMAERLAKISKYWFKNQEIFNESVAHCESHGIKDKGTVTAHQYLVLY